MTPFLVKKGIRHWIPQIHTSICRTDPTDHYTPGGFWLIYRIHLVWTHARSCSNKQNHLPGEVSTTSTLIIVPTVLQGIFKKCFASKKKKNRQLDTHASLRGKVENRRKTKAVQLFFCQLELLIQTHHRVLSQYWSPREVVIAREGHELYRRRG